MKNILIVEDEILIANRIKKTLEDNGYNCIGISVDYADAIELLENTAVDFVLLDVNLNGHKSGIDIANYINLKLPAPFIFLTSYNDTITLNKLKLVNPVGYINKPINESTLLTKIDIYFSSLSKISSNIISLK